MILVANTTSSEVWRCIKARRDVRAKGRAFSFQIEFGVKYRVILLSLVPFWVFLTFFSLIWRWFGWCYCFVPSFKQQFNYVTHVIFSFYYLKLVYLLLTLKIRFVQEFSHFWSVILKFNCDLSVCIGGMTVHPMTSLILGPSHDLWAFLSCLYA